MKKANSPIKYWGNKKVAYSDLFAFHNEVHITPYRWHSDFAIARRKYSEHIARCPPNITKLALMQVISNYSQRELRHRAAAIVSRMSSIKWIWLFRHAAPWKCIDAPFVLNCIAKVEEYIMRFSPLGSEDIVTLYNWRPAERDYRSLYMLYLIASVDLFLTTDYINVSLSEPLLFNNGQIVIASEELDAMTATREAFGQQIHACLHQGVAPILTLTDSINQLPLPGVQFVGRPFTSARSNSFQHMFFNGLDLLAFKKQCDASISLTEEETSAILLGMASMTHAELDEETKKTILSTGMHWIAGRSYVLIRPVFS